MRRIDHFSPKNMIEEMAATFAVIMATVGILGMFFLFWFPLISYSWHYWAGY